jgi:hypothetical protein
VTIWPDPECPLDQRIEVLHELHAARPGDAEVCGRLGDALLDRFDRDGDDATLTEATARFDEAVRAAPEHERQLGWRFWLGVGHAELGSRQWSLPCYDRALAEFTRVLDAVPDEDPDRDLALVCWMEARWDHFFLRQCQDGLADDRQDVLRLVADLTARTPAGTDPDHTDLARLVLGMAYSERHRVTGDRADLDRAIAELASVLGRLPADLDKRELGWSFLVDAYLRRAAMDDEPADLDRAVRDADVALADTVPGTPGWRMLLQTRAGALEARWDRHGDLGDLDRAIDDWDQVHADGPTPWTAANGGRLLLARAEARAEPGAGPEDIVRAVPLLELAAESPDDEEPWRSQLTLGRALRLRWSMAGVPGSLEAADRSLAAALASRDAQVDVHLLILLERALVAMAMFERDTAADHPPPMPSVKHMRGVLEECGDLVEREVTASPDVRAPLAACLGCLEVWSTGHDLGAFDPGRIRGRLTLGLSVPDAGADFRLTLEGLIALVDSHDDFGTVDGKAESGTARIAGMVTRPELDMTARVTFQKILPVLAHSRALRRGDLRGLHGSVELMRGLASETSEPRNAGEALELQVLALAAEMHRHAHQGDLAAVEAIAGRAAEILAVVPATSTAMVTVKPLLSLLGQLPAIVAGRSWEAPDLAGFTGADGTLMQPLRLAMTVLDAIGRIAEATVRRDRPGVRATAMELTELAGVPGQPGAIRFGVVYLAGRAWLETLRGDPGDVTALAQAARWLGEAASLAGGPQNPLWANVCLGWAESVRTGGHRKRARELGLQALQGHCWQVMLQSGTDFAIEAARQAADHAAQVTSWCLEDRAGDDLLAALDAGRGLVLHAATASRGVAEELVARGHDALAAEWQATAGTGRDQVHGGVLGAIPVHGAMLGATPVTADVPDDLRERVLHAIGDDILAGFGRHERVRPAEVSASLRALGADGLVYLVPANAWSLGCAVVLSADGAMDVIALPGLDVSPESVVGRWSAGGSRPLAPGRDAQPAERRRAADTDLDELCRWAWRACVGRLVEHTRGWRVDGPVRLVLVPMGPLGLVPWHAAYTDGGGTRHYALHDVVVSYAVSARALRATAAHDPRDIRAALVVGNPTGDLGFAGEEARAVHAEFYPDGTFLGATAEPDGVLDWVAAASPGPSLLHLACHGCVDPAHPADAHLVLAGGTRLAVRTLAERSRLVSLDIDQVFLAACTTNVSGADHDEALSLATAFLAAGARTVFGSLWPVPDADTSVLMFMVHHYLRRERLAPAQALRRAQLWMLDPDRAAPPEMPAVLATTSGGAGSAHPRAWAGFTHLGR